ncbi:response regulator [Acidipila rosea]|uniref:response regulator n=1 Tax=Acidipila rosea TaxID=768535 RepID=UPI00140431FD|nr:response regulator [Acidipila rosea]
MAKILCVDDDPAVIVLKTAILEQAGHTVRSCSTADDAIRLLEEERFDAVVTDWRLGDGRGRTIVEAAKSRFSVPVVVVSGYVGEAFQAAEPLADLYLEKPADPRELVQVVDALLRTRRDSASLGI